MNCLDAERELIRRLYQEETAPGLDVHLATCAACREALQSMGDARELYRFVREPIPAAVRARALALRPRRVPFGLAAAALLAVGILAVGVLSRRTATPEPPVIVRDSDPEIRRMIADVTERLHRLEVRPPAPTPPRRPRDVDQVREQLDHLERSLDIF